jgi:hypothetical protein
MTKQTVVEEQVVLEALKYVRSVLKHTTTLCLDAHVTSRDIARSINRDMRTTLSVPAIYASLKIMHRCNAYLGILADSSGVAESRPKFPPSHTPVDFTVREITRQWMSYVDMLARVESDWHNPDWNATEQVHMIMTRVVNYNTEKFFGVRFENGSE